MSSAKLSAVALLLLAVLPLSACASSEQAPAPASASSGFSEEIRVNFLESCEAQDGATAARCGCALDAIEKTFSEKQFIKLEMAIATGTGASDEDLDKITDALTSCIE